MNAKRSTPLMSSFLMKNAKLFLYGALYLIGQFLLQTVKKDPVKTSSPSADLVDQIIARNHGF